MLAWKSCPICTSEFTVHLQDIYLQRQSISVPQLFCMTCKSFFHVSNYQENEAAHENDAVWLVQHPGVENVDLAREIVDVLGARRVFEAGCGVGELLLALQARGAAAEGIDPNSVAVGLAVEKGARATSGYFSTLDEPVDAVLAIDVIEHVPDPRAFFSELRASVVENGIIVVRVPEVNEDLWAHLKGADHSREYVWPDPFMDNSVHINHFSAQGIQMMGESLGATYAGRMLAGCHLFRRS
jgi:SAM-dependent methyltransferase